MAKWMAVLWTVSAAQAAVQVWVVDSLTRVRPADSAGATRSAAVNAARNEYAAFQIAVRGADQVAAAGSRLRGPRGHSIGAENVVVYREHYVEAKTPSPLSKEGAGWYPDALVPASASWKGPEPCPTFWVDVYVPRDAAAGRYRGTITVTAAGASAKVPVELTVRDFTLPDTPAMRSNFGSASRVVQWYGAAPGSAEARKIDREFAEALAGNRLCPPIPPYLLPKVLADGTVDASETHPALKEWMEHFHITGFPIQLQGRDPLGADRERNANYLRSMYAYLKANGWQDLSYIYVLDEPNTEQAYETVRQRARFIHETQPGIKVLCTEQPTPQKPEWGTLAGSVDIWVPLWPLYEEADANARLAAGEELWSYTALTQTPQKRVTPFWQLDFPLLNYRIPMWINWRCGMKGLLYWTAVYWDKAIDMWTDPLTFRKRYNLEGLLLYPGEKAGATGLLQSMRMKQIRDGEQDYEYFVLAAKAGHKEEADRIVRGMARSWTDWETDAGKLFPARAELAKLIPRAR